MTCLTFHGGVREIPQQKPVQTRLNSPEYGRVFKERTGGEDSRI